LTESSKRLNRIDWTTVSKEANTHQNNHTSAPITSRNQKNTNNKICWEGTRECQKILRRRVIQVKVTLLAQIQTGMTSPLNKTNLPGLE
jgi:hypothetical protein